MRKRLICSLVLIMTLTMVLILVSLKSKTNFVTYDNFISLYNKMNTELQLTNYKNMGGNQGVQLIYIDERLSFGKRNFLTINNKDSNTSTQYRIEYMSDDGQSMVGIDLIYLSKSLDNDLLYWSNPLGENKENDLLRKTFTENIIAHNNILVKISLRSVGTNEINASMLTAISLEVVEYIQSTDVN